MSENNLNTTNNNQILVKQTLYQDLYIKDIDDELENQQNVNIIKRENSSNNDQQQQQQQHYNHQYLRPVSPTARSKENKQSVSATNNLTSKKMSKAVNSDRSLTTITKSNSNKNLTVNSGASSSSINNDDNKNNNNDTNNNNNSNKETYFKTQPSDEDEKINNKIANQTKFKVPLIKLNEFSNSNGKYIDDDFDNNNNNIVNEFNGIKLKSVTDDHSKDYTSDSGSQDSDQEDKDKDHRNIKRMFHQNSHNDNDEETETGNNSTKNDFNLSMIAPLDDSANSSSNNDNDVEKNNHESSPSSPVTKPINLDIFKLLDKNSKKFILKPSNLGLTIKSQIFRQKGLYPQYRYYIENLDGNLLLIMTARKKKKSKTHCYVINSISFDLNNIYKYIETPIAKLKSNLLGTQFVLYDFGLKPKPVSSSSNQLATERSNSSNGDSSELSEEVHHNNKANSFDSNGPSSTGDQYSANRKEYACISYELNLLGIKGPRTMTVIIPGMDKELNREDYVLKCENDSLHMAWKQIDFNLKNKARLSAASSPKKSPSSSSIKRQSLSPSHDENRPKSPDVLSQTELDHIGSGSKQQNKLSSSSKSSTSSLNNTIQTKPVSNVVKLINKSPEWHKEINSFALNFNGRVTKASTKNFQIVHETNTDYIIMQFGKVDKDLYTCDYSYPICALQAFSIAITSLDNKLGCD